MTGKEILNALNDLEDDLIEDAKEDTVIKKRKKRKAWMAAAAVVLVVMTGGMILSTYGLKLKDVEREEPQKEESKDSHIFKESGIEGYGWIINSNRQVLHKDSGSKEGEVVLEITDVNPSLSDYVDACFLNEDCAFFSYFSESQKKIAMEYSNDGGESWNQTFIPYQEYGGPNEAHISFVDEQTGYLLYCSDPAAGKMTKVLYVSKDGGKSFEKKADLSDVTRNHPYDMLFFTEQLGYMVTKYYGDEGYLYQTQDGGLTWNQVTLEIPNEKAFSYVEGVLLEKEEDSKEEATLLLQGVGEKENVSLKYITKDSGMTWMLVEE